MDPGSIRKLGATAAALLFVTAALAVDVNKATQADLESVKGIGAGSAAKLSQAELTVHGGPYASAADGASAARK